MAKAAIKAGANQTIAANQNLIVQGSSSANLIIINQGEVQIGTKTESGSKKNLYRIKGPCIIGFEALIMNKPVSYFATSSSQVIASCYPSSKENLLKILASKPNIAILLLRSVYKEVVEAINLYNSTNSFLEQLVKNNDSLCLAYSQIVPKKFEESEAENVGLGVVDPILPQAKVILDTFIEKGGEVPKPLTKQFFIADHSALIDHNDVTDLPYDQNELNYLRRIVSFPAPITSAIVQKDSTFFMMTLQKLSTILSDVLNDLENNFHKVEEIRNNILVGDLSWLAKCNMEIELFEQNMSTVDHKDLYLFSQFFNTLLETLEQKYQRLWSISIGDAIDKKIITNFLAKEPEVASLTVADDTSETRGKASILAELKGSSKKIFTWAELSTEKFVEFQTALIALKELKNPLDHEGDARKLRRQLNKIYWDLYQAAALKYLRDRKPLSVQMQMFFNFGFLDEDLLEDEQLVFLYENHDLGKSDYPIHTALEWLALVYDKKVPTSVNELGLTYFEILKQEHRDKGWKRESDLPPEFDSADARVKFEIKSMLEPTVKLTSGSIMNHMAILSKYTITQSLPRSLANKEAIANELDRLLAIDFSVFHREVLFEIKGDQVKREFIQTKIIPNIILVPSAGNVFQFWQDREGKDRMSPGRLLCASLVSTDLFEMIMAGAAALRWETLKTILGPDWNNISKSSMTADYTDYVQFFKKNRELSPEVKEKLSAEFKRFRDDRSRFIHDYSLWIKFESEGTQRFNKVARKIFSKHIPFAKPLRDKLLNLPSYADVIQKSINIRKRKAREVEPRYKKIRQLNKGELPFELEETVRFYNMEY